MKKTVFLLTLLCIVGFVFRMWIAYLVPQPFINDQRDYEYFASKMLKDPHMIASHSFRTYPTSLFVAVIYRIFGFANHQAVYVAQAIMDTSVILMVYYVIKKGLKQSGVAWLGAIIYALNPFTSGYVNVELSEVLSVWTVATTVVTGVFFLRRPSWVRGLLFGLAVGIAAETRSAAFFWAVCPVGLLFFFVPFAKAKGAYIAIGLGLILTVLYPLYANWRDFKAFNISTVDSVIPRELYNGAIIKHLGPLAPPLPYETYVMYSEYYTEWAPERQNEAYRHAMAMKYYQKTSEVISRDPLGYIRTCFNKMWYTWQKEAIYAYVEPNFESLRIYTYVLNLLLLATAVDGMIFWPVVKGKKNSVSNWIRWTIIGSVVYGTLAFCVTHGENRLTIPFYPLLAISSAVGIFQLTRGFRHQ